MVLVGGVGERRLLMRVRRTSGIVSGSRQSLRGPVLLERRRCGGMGLGVLREVEEGWRGRRMMIGRIGEEREVD